MPPNKNKSDPYQADLLKFKALNINLKRINVAEYTLDFEQKVSHLKAEIAAANARKKTIYIRQTARGTHIVLTNSIRFTLRHTSQSRTPQRMVIGTVINTPDVLPVAQPCTYTRAWDRQ